MRAAPALTELLSSSRKRSRAQRNMSVLDVPGMITQREEVTVSSDEEDVHFGTFAPLKKGDEKKKALTSARWSGRRPRRR